MPNEEARMAKALEGIERHNKELVRVFAALNENLVAVAKLFSTWLAEEDTNKDPNQLTIDELRAAEEQKHELREQEEKDDAAEGRIW